MKKKKNILKYLYDGVAYAWHDFYVHYLRHETRKLLGRYPNPISHSDMDRVRLMFYIQTKYKNISDQDIIDRCKDIVNADPKMFIEYLERARKGNLKPWYLHGFDWYL